MGDPSTFYRLSSSSLAFPRIICCGVYVRKEDSAKRSDIFTSYIRLGSQDRYLIFYPRVCFREISLYIFLVLKLSTEESECRYVPVPHGRVYSSHSNLLFLCFTSTKGSAWVPADTPTRHPSMIVTAPLTSQTAGVARYAGHI